MDMEKESVPAAGCIGPYLFFEFEMVSKFMYCVMLGALRDAYMYMC